MKNIIQQFKYFIKIEQFNNLNNFKNILTSNVKKTLLSIFCSIERVPKIHKI